MSRFIALALAGLALAACESVDQRTDRATDEAEADCPEEVRTDLHLAASSVYRAMPTALDLHDESGQRPRQLARRVMISTSPKSAASGLKVLSSTVRLTPLGGVFTGWAEVAESRLTGARAVDVIPGRVRVAPFFSAKTSGPQTLYLDLMIQPGSVAVDELSVTTTPLWNAQGQPLGASEVHILLNPVRHFTVFDGLESDVSLDVQLAPGRHSKQSWRCSVSTHIEFLDADSVLPELWTLHRAGRNGVREEWLSLNDPTSGPFRPMFKNPEAARGFVRWLQATGASQVGQYSIGLFALEGGGKRNIPDINTTVTVPFHGLSADDFAYLEVRRVGEH